MATMAAEGGRIHAIVESIPAADPAPLGLGGFALTTFILSGHNATFIPDLTWIGLAFFYGGLAQMLAGMWEFRNRNVFGATAFSTYGGFWMALGIFVTLAVLSKNFATGLAGANLPNAVAWFLVAFAIFNTYMLLWSTKTTVAVFGVFLTLEITEILLAIGNFEVAHGHSASLVHWGGWFGVVTAGFAWYASAAGVINGMSAPKIVLPVGGPLWAHTGSPLPRGQEA